MVSHCIISQVPYFHPISFSRSTHLNELFFFFFNYNCCIVLCDHVIMCPSLYLWAFLFCISTCMSTLTTIFFPQLFILKNLKLTEKLNELQTDQSSTFGHICFSLSNCFLLNHLRISFKHCGALFLNTSTCFIT